MDTIYLIFLILFIQMLAISFIFFSFLFKEKSMINRFISKITVLSDFLIATGIILTYLLFRNTYNKSIIDTTLAINDRGFNNIQKMLSDNYDKCPHFINSLKFKFQDNYNNNKNNKQHDNQVTISYISNLIFQSVEEYLISASMNKTSDSEWISTFLSYFSSKELIRQWSILKYNFGMQTKMLIELLIKSINENEFNNPDDVTTYSNKFIKSIYFKKILNFKDDTVVTLE